MAMRWFDQFRYSLEKKPVDIWMNADGGGAGVNCTLLKWTSSALATAPATGERGIKSITRNADGDYTITFQDNYQRLLDVDLSVLAKDGSTTPLAVNYWIKAVSPGAAGGATVRIITYLATPNTPVSPGTNDRIYACFTWSDSASF